MRVLALLTWIACACHSPTQPSGPSRAARPPNPAATIVRGVPIACGTIAPEAPCTASVLSTSSGVLTSVSETSCPAARLTELELVTREDGTQLLAKQGRTACETLPMRSEQSSLVVRADGAVAYWGRDGEARHWNMRLPDGTWRISPAIRTDANLALALYEQHGRIIGSFQSMASGKDSEFGYFDEPTNRLRPIRRGTPGSNLQLVPGFGVDEPRTALYTEADKVFVELPDVELGYRRIELPLATSDCPTSERSDMSRRPSGRFSHQANPVLFRTAGGGLWLAITETTGRCNYRRVGALERPREIRDPFLLGHPPPRPPRWVPDTVIERSELVLVPIEHGRFGRRRRTPLPSIEPHYAGPGQFHPAVTATSVRIWVGSYVLEIDPTKLSNVEPLAHSWFPPPLVAEPVVEVATIPPPTNAPALDALRLGDRARSLVMRGTGERTSGDCTIATRTASDPALVDRQLVIRCSVARALAMAVDDNHVVFTQFAQSGFQPYVEISPAGEVTLTPQPKVAHERKLRFERGRLVFGDRLPPDAPKLPPGWMIYDNDGTSVFATSHDRGYELLRGTVDRTQPNDLKWTWQPAFAGGRTPPKGLMSWPLILQHNKDAPTIVYIDDPSKAAIMTVRTPDGTYTKVPSWRGEVPGSSRIHEVAAVEVPGASLPVVAAKIDWSVAVGWPAKDGYKTRVITGIEKFEELPPRASTCTTEAIVEREREEVYSPELFTRNQSVGLAYLSSRIRERLRWTKVSSGCGWIVENRTIANELAVAWVDAKGATEILRVPVEFRPGTGFHGSTLLVEAQGSTLHAIATSYGVSTYTRVRLP